MILSDGFGNNKNVPHLELVFMTPADHFFPRAFSPCRARWKQFLFLGLSEMSNSRSNDLAHGIAAVGCRFA
jgi:hypothetical protein